MLEKKMCVKTLKLVATTHHQQHHLSVQELIGILIYPR